jgi:hypothetical protein
MFDTITNASSFLKILQKASVAVEKEEGNIERCKTRDCERRQALEKLGNAIFGLCNDICRLLPHFLWHSCIKTTPNAWKGNSVATQIKKKRWQISSGQLVHEAG